LIPVFFINVGLNFELHRLLEPGVFLLALELLGAALVVKLLPPFLVLRRMPVREVFASGVLLSARLSLVIAIAKVGADIGLLDPGIHAGVILLAIVTSTFAPTCFRFLAPPLKKAAE
jgi:Kef-type K+ transport system membrane component KefB